MMRLLAAVVIAATAIAVSAAPASATVASPTTSVHASATTTVPLVVGWNAASAITALKAQGFSYVLVPPKGQTVKTPSHWTVTKQTPKGKTSAKSGTKVTLSVTTTAAYIAAGIRSFYAKDYGTFAASSHTGTGTATIAFPKGIRSLLVVATYVGSGSFSITELSAGDVKTTRVPVSAKNSYSGTVALGLTSVKAPTVAITVKGTGSWHVTLEQIADAPIVALPASGTSDRVYLYSGKSAIWTASSPGASTFVLKQISSGSYPNLAVDETGKWSGKIALEPGPSVVEILTVGAWSLK